MPENKRRYPSSIHLASLGAGALCSQTLYIRELLCLFSGTEFTIGFILSSWLFWAGVGGLTAERLFSGVRKPSRSILAFSVLTVSILIPITIILIRAGRSALAYPPGTIPEYGRALLFAFLVMAPTSVIFGAIFNFAVRSSSYKGGTLKDLVSKVYSMEAIGAVAGGLLFNTVLLRFFSHFDAALIISAIIIGTTMYPLRGKISFVSFMLSVSVVALIIFGGARIDRQSRSNIYRGYEYIASISSHYAESEMVKSGEIISIYSGGGRMFSAPDPVGAGEAVHIPMLSVDNPERILIAGGVARGSLDEIFLHSGVKSVQCIELDKALLELYKKSEYLDSGREIEVSEIPFVSWIIDDARRYLSSTTEMYDLIIINTPLPINLMWNRYYTKEFFREVSLRLRNGGLLALSHRSSENYISSELAEALSCVYWTLMEEFDSVSIFPGSTSHFIAGKSIVRTIDIMENLRAREFESGYFTEDTLPERLSPERVSSLRMLVEERKEVRINSDRVPALVGYELDLESKRVGNKVLSLVAGYGKVPGIFILVMTGLPFVGLLVFRGRRNTGAGIVMTGFAALVFQIVIIMEYQAISGVLYHGIVMISASFMAGAATGSAGSLSERFGSLQKRRNLHAFIILIVILFVLFLVILERKATGGRIHETGTYMFSFLNGFLAGSYFLAAVKSASPAALNRNPAFYYSLDLLGGCVGGILGSLVLIPAAGTWWTLALVVLLHGAGSVSVTDRQIE